jgi:hypothetical protein
VAPHLGAAPRARSPQYSRIPTRAFAIASRPAGSPLKPLKKSSTHGTNRSASAGSMPATLRNASVGKRRPNSVTKSHAPAGATSSTSLRHSARMAGSAASIARGENQGFTIRRYLMWSGASICVGTKR